MDPCHWTYVVCVSLLLGSACGAVIWYTETKSVVAVMVSFCSAVFFLVLCIPSVFWLLSSPNEETTCRCQALPSVPPVVTRTSTPATLALPDGRHVRGFVLSGEPNSRLFWHTSDKERFVSLT